MTGGHNIPESQGSLFSAGGRHRCLWPKATRIYKSNVPAKIGTSSHTTNVEYPDIYDYLINMPGKFNIILK